LSTQVATAPMQTVIGSNVQQRLKSAKLSGTVHKL
jgi:hypothetical protein